MSDYLPQELLIKILINLPPKPLIRFRCVSRSWNSLISSPYFISLHTRQTICSSPTMNTKDSSYQIIVRYYSKAQNSEIYSVHADDKDFTHLENPKIEYPFRDDVRFYYRIVGSCNGVLCLFDDLFSSQGSVILWNPVIRRKVKLPLSPQAASKKNRPLAFALGFGFDAHTADYKVVKITYAQNRNYDYTLPPEVEVYALSTGNWHKVNGDVPRNCIVEYFWSQAFINGNVHWTAYRWIKTMMGKEIENLIMVFDITREAFHEIPLPDSLKKHVVPFNCSITTHEPSIAVVHYDNRVCCNNFSIWVMKDYGDKQSWNEMYRVNNLEGGIGMVVAFRAYHDGVLCTSRNGGLNSYDTVTGQRLDLGILGTKNSFYAGPYVESLALLHEGTEARERVESENSDDEEDSVGDVEKSEFWMWSSVAQYLSALLTP